MPQFEFAVRTAESIAKVRNLGQNWGMCSKHCHTCASWECVLCADVLQIQISEEFQKNFGTFNLSIQHGAWHLQTLHCLLNQQASSA